MEYHGGDTFVTETALDFSANINPLGMPESVRAAAMEAAASSERYPDPHCRKLRAALERSLEVPHDWIFCGNGAADVIYRLCYALRPRRALILAPTFSEYEAALNAAGADVTRHNLREEEGFSVTDAALSAMDSADIVFICNPNNPTGSLIDPALMRGIAVKCKNENVTLIVDESFIDFVERYEEHTLLRQLERTPDLVIMRSFTKMFAMPGLRLGYCATSNAALIDRLRRSGPPWAVSLPAMNAGVAALAETEFVCRTRTVVTQERSRLSDRLRALGLSVGEGAANFLLIRDDSGLNLPASLAARGVVVRRHIGFRGLDERYFRIAVRLPHENDRLAECIADISRKGNRP
ncbi:MAG: threonine-phosphate decarboxylase CobD [Oscillospiraceae bacterium]|jgi:threonine-phosphate decarboxylase|nr:threonine-phosphate decarboxylase CobD [Oscillospiraceae bacterium]